MKEYGNRFQEITSLVERLRPDRTLTQQEWDQFLQLGMEGHVNRWWDTWTATGRRCLTHLMRLRANEHDATTIDAIDESIKSITALLTEVR